MYLHSPGSHQKMISKSPMPLKNDTKGGTDKGDSRNRMKYDSLTKNIHFRMNPKLSPASIIQKRAKAYLEQASIHGI